MEDCNSSISIFCSQLRSYCTHIESSCAALRHAVDRKPSSMPSPSLPSLLTSLIDRVSCTSQVVETLEAMTTDTISFEELLGHCMEVYKQNEANISSLEDRLKDYGYSPVNVDAVESDIDYDTNLSVDNLQSSAPPNEETSTTQKSTISSLELPSSYTAGNGQIHSTSTFTSRKETHQQDSLYTGALSLEDLGISAAGLACLAQESSPVTQYSMRSVTIGQDNSLQGMQTACLEVPSFNTHTATVSQDNSQQVAQTDSTDCTSLDDNDGLNNDEAAPLFKPVNDFEYLNSPTWLKMQISFECLNKFIDTICNILAKKTSNGEYTLNQEDLSSLDPGLKVKPCLLFLVKLGRLRTGYENGTAIYHVVKQ